MRRTAFINRSVCLKNDWVSDGKARLRLLRRHGSERVGGELRVHCDPLPLAELVGIAGRAVAETVRPAKYVDVLLVFDYPLPQLEAVKLQVPSSAWGRTGICRFRINGAFEAPLPEATPVTPPDPNN